MMNRLQRERESHGWSRAELARRARLNSATYGLIESGRLKPYDVQLQRIARVLDVDPEDANSLLEGVGQ